MSDERGHSRGGGRSLAVKLALVAAGVLAASGLVVGAGFALLYLVNPVGDEWVCSEGQAPAGNACYRDGSALPAGVTWHPFGNRPMPYNCNKDGWVLIQRPVARRGASDVVQDCVREGTEPPGRWHTAPQR